MPPARSAGFCNRCDTEREVLVTVPWQDDICAECGSPEVVVE